MNRVGFGIIGTGAVAAMHVEALNQSCNAKLVAVYDRNVERARDFAQLHHTEFAATLEEFLARQDIQAVTIATPSGFHLDPALQAAQAGKHLLCEKPLEINLERADKIIECAAKHHVLLGSIFQSRYTQPVQELKKALEGGKLGKIIFASAQLHWHRDPEYYSSAAWRGTWHIDGGGALINQGIHTVDLLLYLNGDVKKVTGHFTTRCHHIETEDTAVAMLEFANGSYGTLECSTACAPGYPKKLEIAGTLGNVVMEGDELKRWDFVHPCPGDETIFRRCSQGSGRHGGNGNPMDFSPDGHRYQIENLAQAILEHRTDLAVSGLEARRAVELVEAIYRSARTGETVEL